MMNAKHEFIKHVEDPESVLCTTISHEYLGWYDDDIEPTSYNLPVNHTPEQYHQFVESLDFNYDNGYGGQELFGYIWFKDGTWSTRGEYDGSEWWEHHHLPAIPHELKAQ